MDDNDVDDGDGDDDDDSAVGMDRKASKEDRQELIRGPTTTTTHTPLRQSKACILNSNFL